MFAKVKEHILIFKKTYNDQNLLKIYKSLKYCKEKQYIKEIAEFLESVEIGDFNIANNIVKELNVLVFGNNGDKEIIDIAMECKTITIEENETLKTKNKIDYEGELHNETKIINYGDKTNVEYCDEQKEEEEYNRVDNIIIEAKNSMNVNFCNLSSEEEKIKEFKLNENTIEKCIETKYESICENTNEPNTSFERDTLNTSMSFFIEKDEVEVKTGFDENNNASYSTVRTDDSSHSTLIDSTIYNQELSESVIIEMEDLSYDEHYYHTALSCIIKPLLHFKAKECVNMLIHLALKTDTRVMQTLTDEYKDNKHWCIEILLHIAQVHVLQGRDFSDELQRANELLTEMIEPLFDESSIDNSTYKKFVCQMILYYLQLEFNEVLFQVLKQIINEDDSQINIAICVSLSKMVNSANVENGSVLTIFNLLATHSNSTRYSLSVQSSFYKAFEVIPKEIFNKYLEWVYDAMSETVLDQIICDHICLEAITNLFVIFCHQYKTREMYLILFFIIFQKGDVMYKRCIDIVTRNLEVIQNNLFDKKVFNKNSVEIDFNKLNTNSEIEDLTEQINDFSFESTVHSFDMYIKMCECDSVVIKNNFYEQFRIFIVSYTNENSEHIKAFLQGIEVLRFLDGETRKFVFDYILNLQLMWREERKCLEFLLANGELFLGDMTSYLEKFEKSKYFYVRMLAKKKILQNTNIK